MKDQDQLVSGQGVTAEATGQPAEVAEMTRLINHLNIREEQEKQEVVQAFNSLRTLIKQGLEDSGEEDVVPANVYTLVNGLIARIDDSISAQLSDVIHDEGFQKLEASWRGLRKFLRESETDASVKVYVLDATKEELLEDLRETELEQSALFRRIYSERIGTFKGQPYGVIIGDYEFGRKATDITLLKRLSNIAAVSHAPFLAAASPTLFRAEWDDFTQMNELRTLDKDFADDPKLAPWRSFRESEDARYVGLVLPRVLMRLPYDRENNPTRTFIFEEDVSGIDGTDHSKYLWGNAVYSMGIRITKAFHLYNWCVAIRGERGGGLVEDLDVHTFDTDHHGTVMKCPTEVPIPYRRDKELSDLGFIGLLWGKDSDQAVFLSGQSCKKPKSFSDPASTANARLSARLPYVFAVSRFAQYIQKILYREIGARRTPEEIERLLRQWMNQFANANDEGGDTMYGRYPLRDFDIRVTPQPDNPGAYNVELELQPRFIFEEARVKISLVAKALGQGEG